LSQSYACMYVFILLKYLHRFVLYDYTYMKRI